MYPKAVLKVWERIIAAILIGFLSCSFEGAQANLAASEPVTVTQDWVYRQIDFPVTFDRLNDDSLKFDENNHPHIVYGGNHLYHAWNTGSGWQTEVVDSSDETGRDAVLAFGPGNILHVGYIGTSSSGTPLYYAYHDKSGWHTEVADNGTSAPGSALSIALDPQGYPHFSLFRGSEVYHVYKDAAGWHSSLIVFFPDNFKNETSIAINASGEAIIVFNYVWGFQYYQQKGDGWEASQPLNQWSVATSPSLILDADGYAHLSYLRYNSNSNRRLYHTYQDAQGWHTEQIGDDETENASAITLDAQNHPQIAYTTRLEIKRALKNGEAWQTEVIKDVQGQDVAIAISPSAQVGISYYSNESVWYGHVQDSTWQVELVDQSGSIYITGFGITPSGLAKVAYVTYNTSGRNLMFATQTQKTWTIETLDQSGMVRNEPSMALDSQGYAHISYANGTGLIHVYQDQAGWHSEMIDNNCPAAYDTLIAVDQSDFPHIMYIDSQMAKYAYQDGAGWHIITDINDFRDWGIYSLFILPDGYPGLLYTGPTDAQDMTAMRFVYRNGSGWQREVIESFVLNDTDFYNGGETTIGPDGKIYVLFGRSFLSGGILKLATRGSSGGWQVQEIGTFNSGRESVRVYATDIALDSQGRLYILYSVGFARSPGYQVLARPQNDGSWINRYLNPTCSKMELDAAGQIYMACYHDNGAILLADPNVKHNYLPAVRR